MREASPWYRASKDAWYVELNGKQIRLAKGKQNRKEAMDAFYKLMTSQPQNVPAPNQLRVIQTCDLFLQHAEKHNTAETFNLYKHFLQSFVAQVGTLLVTELKPFHVQQWLDANPSWKGGRRHATLSVKRVFNWAEKQGLIDKNPIKSVSLPTVNRRTRVLTAEEFQEILGHVPDPEFRACRKRWVDFLGRSVMSWS